jgi:hypothetical protein
MEQTLGSRMIIDGVLIVVTMAVLAWIEARRGDSSHRPVPQKSGMKLVLATIIALGTAAFVTTASAHVVEITTSIPAAKAADDAALREALEAAIDDAVKHAIGFTPTLISLQNARLVGGRIYIMLLVADKSGEELMNQLAADEASSSSEPFTDLQGHESSHPRAWHPRAGCGAAGNTESHGAGTHPPPTMSAPGSPLAGLPRA